MEGHVDYRGVQDALSEMLKHCWSLATPQSNAIEQTPVQTHFHSHSVSSTQSNNFANGQPSATGIVSTLQPPAFGGQHVGAISFDQPRSRVMGVPSLQTMMTRVPPPINTDGYSHHHIDRDGNANLYGMCMTEVNPLCVDNTRPVQSIWYPPGVMHRNPMTMGHVVCTCTRPSSSDTGYESADHERIERSQLGNGAVSAFQSPVPSSSSFQSNDYFVGQYNFKRVARPLIIPNDANFRASKKGSLYSCDSKGYIDCTPGLVLCGKYRMRRQLGSGTFSRVFECDRVHNQSDPNGHYQPQKYAVKVIRNVRSYRFAAKTELDILRMIRANDADGDSCCIHIVDNDHFRGHSKVLSHPIFVFPLLSQSIYSFMRSNKYRPFSYDDAIDLLEQICIGVAFMHSLNIIITDLKPENIMFVDDEVEAENPKSRCFSSPRSTEIKLIDFGSAVVHEPGMVHSHSIQTRHYRAPEVVLNMEWDFSADVWSIGCILVEMIYGRLLFDTRCSIDHLNQMMHCVGYPPPAMLDDVDDQTWSTYFDDNGNLRMDEAEVSPLQCDRLSKYFLGHPQSDDPKGVQLFDLCNKMLQWDPAARITADQALHHPVFRLPLKWN